jgi:hypothetical protein
MLAYVFWHRPFAHVDRRVYEAALMHFQHDLPRHHPPGFVSAASFRIGPVPWLTDMPGYEDWYLVEGSWALDPLNAFAIAGAMQVPHDSAAVLMDEGHGGLYAHAGGEPSPAVDSTVHWLMRPRGSRWQAALDPVRAKNPQVNIWRRQMVLGPASEFAVEAPADAAIDVPAGWQALRVKRVRLTA